MYKDFTIRTVYILEKAGLVVDTAEDAITAADMAVAGEVRHAGLRFAVELYRAAGLGVYPIYKRLDGRVPLERVKSSCEHFDAFFHWA